MAADVYERATSLSDEDKRIQWHLWKFSGLALKREEQYAKAEQAYFHALQLKEMQDGCKLQLQDNDFQGLVFNVLFLSATIMHLPRTAIRPLNDMEKRESVFTTLIQTSGYNVGRGEVLEGYLLGGVEHRIPSIKSQFLTPSGAQLALTVAILKPTFDGYCNHLLHCLKPVIIMVPPNLDNPYTIKPQNRDEKRDFALQEARKEVPKSIRDSAFSRCSNPRCSHAIQLAGNNQQRCRCKATIYCSDDCQKAHWNNGHKEHCASRKKCANPSCGAMEQDLCEFLCWKRCQSAYYCSKECQIAHCRMTDGHKKQCRKAKNAK